MGIFNLTESEKKNILNLHNSARIIKEQVSSAVPADEKSKIMAIQTALNTKYNSGLKVDGILGQNTLTALSNAMKSTNANAEKYKQQFAQMGKEFENKPNPITGAPASGTQTPPAAAPATGTQTPPAAAPATGTQTPPAAAPATGTQTPPPAAGTQTPPPAAGTQTPPPAAGTPTRRDQRRERQDMRRSNRRQMQDLRAQQRGNQ
jgi:lysozyme family protein